MSVFVMIQKADVYYQPSQPGSSPSNKHALAFNGPVPAAAAGPPSQLQLSIKHNITVGVHQWLQLTEADFVRFKNGGKRMPSKTPKVVIDAANQAMSRARSDRTKHPIVEGDVGPYKKGDGNLYKAKLAPAVNPVPAAWSAGNPPQYRTDPKHPMDQNRDHQNNQAALKLRGADPASGSAIAIPQWIHMNGYTFGNKAKPTTVKKRNPDFVGQSRTEWIAKHPSQGLFKEIYHTIRLYKLAGYLTYEIVGSFRYLYKLNVKSMGYAPTPDLDGLLMHYLSQAK